MVRDRAKDPLAATDRLLVDGNNALHALAGGGAARAPVAALIGRIRGLAPASVAIDLVLDGAPEAGAPMERVASGMRIIHSGRISADERILALVGHPPADRADRILVVTNDQGLAAQVRGRGARVASVTWLLGRLEAQRVTGATPSIGRPRPPLGARHDGLARKEADDRPERRWSPGRGATTKRGPGARPPRGR